MKFIHEFRSCKFLYKSPPRWGVCVGGGRGVTFLSAVITVVPHWSAASGKKPGLEQTLNIYLSQELSFYFSEEQNIWYGSLGILLYRIKDLTVMQDTECDIKYILLYWRCDSANRMIAIVLWVVLQYFIYSAIRFRDLYSRRSTNIKQEVFV